jgi:hypothetical protein
MKLNHFLLFLLFFGYGCKPKNNKLIEPVINISIDTGYYTKIEFYCFCMEQVVSSSDVTSTSICETPAPIPLKEIITSNHYYDSIYDKKKISDFVRLLFNKKQESVLKTTYPDSRFVILLKRDSDETDTLVIADYANRIVNFNKKSLLFYPFNVMDSIRHLMGREKISCDVSGNTVH